MSKRTKIFDFGTEVEWKWMGHMVKGTVKQSFEKPISRIYRGTTFKRNGSPEVPAYIVISKAGSYVVKSHSELYRSK